MSGGTPILGPYVLTVFCWSGTKWSQYMQRFGLSSESQAEALGKEELIRIQWRTKFRRLAYRIDQLKG